MVLKVVTGKILETRELRVLRCPSTFGTGARFRLQDRALGAWYIDRLSKILDYLIDNLCHYILSEVTRGGQQESGMDGSILFQNGNLVEPFLASRQTRGPGTDHGPRLSVNNLLGYCQIRAASVHDPLRGGQNRSRINPKYACEIGARCCPHSLPTQPQFSCSCKVPLQHPSQRTRPLLHVLCRDAW
jgi:hypothetical protein